MPQGQKVVRDLCQGCPDNMGSDKDEVPCACINQLVKRVLLELDRAEGKNRNRCPQRKVAAKRAA